MSAHFTETQVEMDGILGEKAWEHAEPATDFRQREPDEGAPATEKTLVYVLFDRENLYIGIRCRDDDPARIVHNEMRFDGDLSSDDSIALIIDTYQDNRGAYIFSVNPNGARSDGKVVASYTQGYEVNTDWNGLWDAAATIDESGWTAEIVIPFRSLRFPRLPAQTWGFNVRRFIKRKNEEVLWQSWRRDYGLLQMDQAGTLQGLADVSRGRNLEVKPYVLAGVEDEQGDYDDRFKYGLDVRYPLTSDMTLDITTFTDFAQIEADRNRINLTRFDLYYPEKRHFFLEGAEIFDVGSPYSTPYYSRRIGISDDRQEVPILGGLKLTGKTGKYQVGAIAMRTDEEGSQPTTNYGVLRLKRDLFSNSSIGVLATGLNNADDHENQVVTADMSLRTTSFLGDKNLMMEGWISTSNTPGIHHGVNAGRLSIAYPNDLVSVLLLRRIIGENYNPEIGFIQRKGIKKYVTQLDFSPRPGIPHIRQLKLRPFHMDHLTDSTDKLLTRKIAVAPFGFTTYGEDEFQLFIHNQYERLTEDFRIFRDSVIPGGEYEWWFYEASFQSNPARKYAFGMTGEWGDYFDGARTGGDATFTCKINRFTGFSLDAVYYDIGAGGNDFEAQEYGIRPYFNLTTRLSTNAYLQWNNETREVNLNLRVHFIPKIGSDIYFVYNNLWDGFDDYRTSYQTALFKVSYLHTF